MNKTSLLEAADHIAQCNEAEALEKRKAPLRRTLAIAKITALTSFIGHEVDKASCDGPTTVDFANRLEEIADALEGVYQKVKELSTNS